MKAIVGASSRVLIVLSTVPTIGTPKCASNMAGIVLGPLMGYIVDFTKNDYVLCLSIAAGVGLFGAVVYAFVVGKVEPLPLRK